MLTILPLLLTSTTAAAASTAIAYVATAKRSIPITNEEATIIWKIHKQTSNCKSHKMQPLTQGHGKVTGFRCQCGYRYTQKKPLLSRKMQTNTMVQPRMGRIQLDSSLNSVRANSNSALK